jgi:hypothetical protein
MNKNGNILHKLLVDNPFEMSPLEFKLQNWYAKELHKALRKTKSMEPKLIPVNAVSPLPPER